MLAINTLVSQVFNVLFPVLAFEYRDPGVIRPSSDPAMLLFFVSPFILGIILSFVWNKIKTFFGEERNLGDGVVFGFYYWLLVIPGMVITYSTFPLSTLIVFSWTVSALFQGLVAGVVLVKLNR